MWIKFAIVHQWALGLCENNSDMQMILPRNKISFKNSRPSLKWWGGLNRRHKRLRLRQPEGTAAICHQCMDHAKVQKYFGCLKSIMDASNFYVKPASIWNMDETGVQLDHKPGKIVVEKVEVFAQQN